MKLSVRKELHLTPWELLCALRTAGIVDQDCCAPDVKLVAKTEVNEGRVIVVSWSNSDKKLEAS